jgi:hypothetical protein
MGLFFPIIGGIFSLGVIGLMIFSFVTVMAGFVGGGLMFAIYGKGNFDVWRGWWVLITGGLTLFGLISFIASL